MDVNSCLKAEKAAGILSQTLIMLPTPCSTMCLISVQVMGKALDQLPIFNWLNSSDGNNTFSQPQVSSPPLGCPGGTSGGTSFVEHN